MTSHLWHSPRPSRGRQQDLQCVPPIVVDGTAHAPHGDGNGDFEMEIVTGSYLGTAHAPHGDGNQRIVSLLWRARGTAHAPQGDGNFLHP